MSKIVARVFLPVPSPLIIATPLVHLLAEIDYLLLGKMVSGSSVSTKTYHLFQLPGKTSEITINWFCPDDFLASTISNTLLS